MKKVLLFLLLIGSVAASFAQNLPSVSGTATIEVNNNGTFGTVTPAQIVAAAGVAGTVTSVGATVPTGLSVAGSPITTSGTIAITNNMAAGPVRSAGVGGALSSGAISLTTEVTGLLPNANLANSLINNTVGTAGTNVAFSAATTALGGTLTLNVPDASATARGVVTTAAQAFAGDKSFSGVVTTSNGRVATGSQVEVPTVLTAATTLTATSNSRIIADATTAAFTITLPTTPPSGTIYAIVKKNITANSITIAAGGANTIQGLATMVIYTGRSVYRLTFDGADWSVND